MAGTVIVGCKLPNGLLLEVNGQTIRINGSARHNMPSPTRKDLNTDVVAGDGLTMVDKDFWEAWLRQYKDYAPVVSGAVYASDSRPYAEDRAKDTEEVKTGLEPIDPLKVKGLEPTDDTLKAIKKSEQKKAEQAAAKK